MPKHAIYKDKVKDWALMYADGKSVWNIAQTSEASGQLIHSYLKRYGVKFRNGSQSIRRSPIRESAFDEITQESSYWLGLLYADGSMVASGNYYTLGLVAHSDDEQTIADFWRFLGRDGAHILRRNDKRAVSMKVGCKQICARLLELGVIPKKTHVIRFPDFLPNNCVAAFCRGYLDGDGCVYFHTPKRYVTPQGRVAFSGNPEFIKGLSDQIFESSCVSPTTTTIYKKTSTVSYEGREKLIRLCNWLYADKGPFLPRKKDKLHNGLGIPVGYAAIAGELSAHNLEFAQ